MRRRTIRWVARGWLALGVATGMPLWWLQHSAASDTPEVSLSEEEAFPAEGADARLRAVPVATAEETKS